jgi:very-short-patch-repair endonuclease
MSVIKNDARKEKFLKDNGFTVKRYANAQLFSNLEFVLEEIKSYCENHGTTPFPLLKEEGI